MVKNKSAAAAVKDILSEVQASLARSDEAIASSEALLENLERDRKKSEEEYEKAQAAVDRDIKRIVQGMDEATVQFVAATE